MTYNEFIQNIIDTRGQWSVPDIGIWENHHIVPLCMGGQPEEWDHDTIHENLIWLAPKEHYYAHYLLFLENKDNHSLGSAFWSMNIGHHWYGYDKVEISAEEYERGRILFSQVCSLRYSGSGNPMYGKNAYEGKSEEEMKAISRKKSKKESGENNQAWGKHWYTNGITTVFTYDCPDGYWKGSTNYKNGGTHWYNNGTISKQFFDSEVPDGWVLGRLKYKSGTIENMSLAAKGRHWYTNGKDNKHTYECPDGYWPGRTVK